MRPTQRSAVDLACSPSRDGLDLSRHRWQESCCNYPVQASEQRRLARRSRQQPEERKLAMPGRKRARTDPKVVESRFDTAREERPDQAAEATDKTENAP